MGRGHIHRMDGLGDGAEPMRMGVNRNTPSAKYQNPRNKIALVERVLARLSAIHGRRHFADFGILRVLGAEGQGRLSTQKGDRYAETRPRNFRENR